MGKLKSIINRLRILFANNEKYIEFLRKQGVRIGENCVIDKTAIWGTEPYLVEIGNYVRVTHEVKFITHDGGFWTLRNLGLLNNQADKFGKISIGDNTNIGWNATIMPGVKVGKNCVIGCNAVVTKNIPDNSVAAGVPAKVIQSIEEYANKNKDKCVITKGMNSGEKYKYLMDHLRD
ncbi:acyltransferase [Priestia aryabhattai]